MELLAQFGERFVLREEYVGGEGQTLRVADGGGRDLVLKVLPLGIVPEEAALLSGLQHPAIPRVLEVGRLADGCAYVLREHVEGEVLTSLPADPAEMLDTVREILAVLAYVHLRGIVHLDLKPANLIRRPSGRVALLDFGLAARQGQRGRGGTPYFAAPELLLGATPDARADLFSLGAMVAQALWPSGRLPLARFLRLFPRDDFWAAAGVQPHDFPAPFRAFLERCLSRRANRRFHDAQAAMEFLGGGSGRPSLGLLTPDPVTLWQAEIEAVAVDDGAEPGSVVLRGGAVADRSAIAMHLLATMPGFARVVEHDDHTLLEGQGGTAGEVVLVPPDAPRLMPFLRAVFMLDDRALLCTADWLAAQRCDGAAAIGAVLVTEVERGEIQPAGTRWGWPAASSGRLGDTAESGCVAVTVDAVRALAARGRGEAAIAMYRRGVGDHPTDDVPLQAALAEGLLDAGEPARALPFCAADPVLRAQALLDMGQVGAAERELARAHANAVGSAHPRQRRLAAQLLLTRGAAVRVVELLDPPESTSEELVLVAAFHSAGRVSQRDRRLADLLDRLSPTAQPYALASALTVAGHAARQRGDLEAAQQHFERAAGLLFGLGQVRPTAGARLNLGLIAKDRGDTAEAIERLREARALYEHAGDAAGAAIATANLGSAALAGGDAAEARAWLERGAEALETLGNVDAGRLARVLLARACAVLGDRTAATAALDAVGEPDTDRLRRESSAVRELLAAPDPRPPAPETTDPMPTVPGPSRELFRTFLAVNRQLAQETDLDKAMKHLLDAAVTLTGGRQGYLLVTRDNGVQREFASGDPGVSGQAFSRSLAHRAIDLQRTLTGAEGLADRELQEMPSIRNLEIRSAVCAPFRSAGGTSGAIYVEHSGRSDVFDDSDKEALEVLADQAAIAVDRMLRDEAMSEELQRSRRELAVVQRGRRRPTNLIGNSKPMRLLRAEIDKLAPLDLAVLVQGDTGTGKELVARALHQRSTRHKQPFVAENCSALPAELLERELFGHVQGAFTGADSDRPGLLELASGGTLFLDEVGDMPSAMQAKLLRALQEKTIRRVGGSEEIQLDLRLVAATHKDLRAMVGRGEFREDLFFRLAAVELRVPPLRERGADVLALAEHFLAEVGSQQGRAFRLGQGVAAAITGYPWPGNVRELEHVIARAALLCDSDEITDLKLPELPAPLEPAATLGGPAAATSGAAAVVPLREVERLAIKAALEHLGGDKAKAARALGISRTALYEKIKRYEIR